jgi:dTDP-4-amino-4,6-dideoxygalactose transaminase
MSSISKVPYLDIDRAHRSILPQLKNAIEAVLKSGNIVLGPELQKFEQEYAKFSGVNYCARCLNFITHGAWNR